MPLTLMQSVLEEISFLDTLASSGVTWEHRSDQGVHILCRQRVIPTPDGVHGTDAAFCP